MFSSDFKKLLETVQFFGQDAKNVSLCSTNCEKMFQFFRQDAKKFHFFDKMQELFHFFNKMQKLFHLLRQNAKSVSIFSTK